MAFGHFLSIIILWIYWWHYIGSPHRLYIAPDANTRRHEAPLIEYQFSGTWITDVYINVNELPSKSLPKYRVYTASHAIYIFDRELLANASQIWRITIQLRLRRYHSLTSRLTFISCLSLHARGPSEDAGNYRFSLHITDFHHDIKRPIWYISFEILLHFHDGPPRELVVTQRPDQARSHTLV